MSVLAKIVEQRRLSIAEAQQAKPRQAVEDEARRAPALRGFLAALRSGRGLIAEFKRASPSNPNLAPNLDLAETVRQYRENGARALSILTEPDFFRGSNDDLAAARRLGPLPALRKDFLVDEYQIFESRAVGADAVLLILAALAPDEFRALRSLAESLGMDVLVETHTKRELDFALAERCPLVGINNRNLETLEVDPEHGLALVRSVPPEATCLVIESGLRDAKDLIRFRRAGADAFLIGESLLRAPSPGAQLRAYVQALAQEP